MVNFNNETTVTKAKSEILVMIIIELRHYVLQALEQHNENKYRNINVMTDHTVKSRIMTLYYMIRASMKDDIRDNNKEYTDFKTNIKSNDFDKLISAFEYMEEYLHKNDIINFTSKKNYDPSNPIAEDEAKGI